MKVNSQEKVYSVYIDAAIPSYLTSNPHKRAKIEQVCRDEGNKRNNRGVER